MALAAAVREELRRAGADRAEIARFTDEALALPDVGRVRSVAREWVTVEPT